jgi:DNA-binding protein WhiA
LPVRLEWTLRSAGVPPKRTQRKGRIVVYYKDFDAIVELLTLIGAFGAVLRLEDVRALRETKNRIHRLVNTEAANLQRSAQAAAAHRRVIEYLESAYGLPRLSPALREVAELRLKYPDESLAEIGRRCNPAISKPAVSGRLATLSRLAESIAGVQGSAKPVR